MHAQHAARPPSAKGGPEDLSSISIANISENSHSQHARQEAIAALRREFAAEALPVAAIKAAHAADDVSLGDYVGAEREIRLAISHLRAGAAAFRKMQSTIEAIAEALRAEAVL